MALYTILMLAFLLFAGTTISATYAKTTPEYKRPTIYWDKGFMALIHSFWVPTLVVFIILMIMNWKITLIITIPALFLASYSLQPVAEYLIVLPLNKILIRKGK
jgi:hypothetical protein